MLVDRADVVIVGGGPAGLEAALVLARAQKRTVVFDDPAPPRNGASHGVHNFIGVEGRKPAEVREIAWAEIRPYDHATLRPERVIRVRRDGDAYVVEGEGGAEVRAERLILAFGYRDAYPEVPGFSECWADTVIPCPFCDGYENRGRVWGVVPGTPEELAIQPKLAKHWASEVHLFLSPDLDLEPAYRRDLVSVGIAIHPGRIEALEHEAGKLHAVTLVAGTRHPIETLLWVPKPGPVPLADRMDADLGLSRDEAGLIQTDENLATNLPGVWAVGDVKGWTGGMSAAAAGYVAAVTLLKASASD